MASAAFHLIVISTLSLIAAVPVGGGGGGANDIPNKISSGIKNVKDSKEAWGYVNIRPDAYMFWWLYYASANGSNYQDQPLVMWLQGGPGASSTGYGNFAEIGPLDINLNPRNTTWVKYANVLFVDNPVGTGYSYVTNESALATNNSQIAADLLVLFKTFLQKLPEFQKIPLYIFSESYGGKMAADFSSLLYKTVASGKLPCNFKGVALGDSWISPIDSVLTWGPYLYSTSLVDENGLETINTSAWKIQQALSEGYYSNATELWGETESIVELVTNGVNFYNILDSFKPLVKNVIPTGKLTSKALDKLFQKHVAFYAQDDLSQLMNGPIRQKLHTIPENVTWGGQSDQVFSALSEDFMRPVTTVVENLLNNTNIVVIVYNGQLDLIVDTMGTLAWVSKLKWMGLKNFLSAERKSITLESDQVVGFTKQYKNLAFYWILNAGHMIPQDAGYASVKMLQLITQGSKQ